MGPPRYTLPAVPATRARLAVAFVALYLFWGATYLGIRVAVETIPPFVMASARYFLAGGLLLGALRLRGPLPRLTAANWWSSAVISFFLLLGGNGLVVWAEQRVPSGLAALLVSTSPLWMILFDWLLRHAAPPRPRQLVGLGLGLAGTLALQWPGGLGHAEIALVPALALLGASVSWSFGSIWGKDARVPDSPLVATALQMLTGGVWLLLASLATGQLFHVHPSAISARSLVAFAYLVGLGSLGGFTAFVYVMKHASAARGSTYAYVNPVIAVGLGWAVAGERGSPRMLGAAAVILVGVALVLWKPQRAKG